MLTETKLMGMKEIPSFHDYAWLGHNRTDIKRTAKCGSGGVGLLVKRNILDKYYKQLIDNTHEGILIYKFTNKQTGTSLAIAVCYLPPAESSRPVNSNVYYNHILSKMYELGDCDITLLGGDFNGRIGNEQDFIHDVDNIPSRMTTDDVKPNSRGRDLLEFLFESKMCTVNGRITPECDNYTFIAPRGSSVVDYFITPHECLKYYKRCEVHRIRSLCDTLQLQSFRLPDHSVLECHIELRQDTVMMDSRPAVTRREDSERHRHVEDANVPTYRRNNCAAMFNDDISTDYIARITNIINNAEQSQKDIDECYKQLCDTYYREMDLKLPKAQQKTNNNRRKRAPKPWWASNPHLDHLWRDLVEAERAFLKYKGSASRKRTLRETYKQKQQTFDRHYNKAKRQYHRMKQEEIMNFETDNPRKFWDEIRKLGPRQKPNIPMEVKTPEGEVITDIEDVLDSWKNSFANLYKPQRTELVDNPGQTNMQVFTNVLDEPFERHEVAKVKSNAKSGWTR